MDEEFSIFNISFPWFGLIGSLIVISVGMVVSHCTGGYDISKTGTKLISPVAHCLVPREIREMELQVISQSPVHGDEPDNTHWTWSSPDEAAQEAGEKVKIEVKQ